MGIRYIALALDSQNSSTKYGQGHCLFTCY